MMRGFAAHGIFMKRLLGFGLACLGALAHADEPAAAAQAPARSELPLWELGVFGVGISQLAYPGADQQIKRGLVLPYAIYRGEVLRADDQGAGLRAVHTDRFELDVSFSGSFGNGSKPVRAREGMRRLGTLAEFGPVGRWFLNGRDARDRLTFELPVRGVFDAGDGLRRQGVSLEPELSLERRVRPQQWGYGLGVSARFGDGRLARTFYEVLPGEALPDRPAYSARSGLIAWRLNGTLVRDLTPDLRLVAFGRIESVSGAANRDSPLVRQTVGYSYGIGLTYTFARSAARARD